MERSNSRRRHLDGRARSPPTSPVVRGERERSRSNSPALSPDPYRPCLFFVCASLLAVCIAVVAFPLFRLPMPFLSSEVLGKHTIRIRRQPNEGFGAVFSPDFRLKRVEPYSAGFEAGLSRHVGQTLVKVNSVRIVFREELRRAFDDTTILLEFQDGTGSGSGGRHGGNVFLQSGRFAVGQQVRFSRAVRAKGGVSIAAGALGLVMTLPDDALAGVVAEVETGGVRYDAQEGDVEALDEDAGSDSLLPDLTFAASPRHGAGTRSVDSSGDPPATLVVSMPEGAEYFFALGPELWNGMPQWQEKMGAMVVYSSSSGRWLLGRDSVSQRNNRGAVRSRAGHGGRMPHRVAEWERIRQGVWEAVALRVVGARKRVVRTHAPVVDAEEHQHKEPALDGSASESTSGDGGPDGSGETEAKHEATQETSRVTEGSAQSAATEVEAATPEPESDPVVPETSEPTPVPRTPVPRTAEPPTEAPPVAAVVLGCAGDAEHPPPRMSVTWESQQSVFELMEKPWNNVATWQDQRANNLYSNGVGRWVIGGENAPKNNLGAFRTSLAHKGKMPHAMMYWEKLDSTGRRWDPVEVTIECHTQYPGAIEHSASSNSKPKFLTFTSEHYAGTFALTKKKWGVHPTWKDALGRTLYATPGGVWMIGDPKKNNGFMQTKPFKSKLPHEMSWQLLSKGKWTTLDVTVGAWESISGETEADATKDSPRRTRSPRTRSSRSSRESGKNSTHADSESHSASKRKERDPTLPAELRILHFPASGIDTWNCAFGNIGITSDELKGFVAPKNATMFRVKPVSDVSLLAHATPRTEVLTAIALREPAARLSSLITARAVSCGGAPITSLDAYIAESSAAGAKCKGYVGDEYVRTLASVSHSEEVTTAHLEKATAVLEALDHVLLLQDLEKDIHTFDKTFALGMSSFPQCWPFSNNEEATQEFLDVVRQENDWDYKLYARAVQLAKAKAEAEEDRPAHVSCTAKEKLCWKVSDPSVRKKTLSAGLVMLKAKGTHDMVCAFMCKWKDKPT